MSLIGDYAKHGLLLAMLMVVGTAQATNAVVTTCNEMGFTDALSAVDNSGGGTITFNCGSASVTIPFTSYKLVTAGNDVINGGNKIVFDGGGTSPFFQVSNGRSLTLENLKVQRGGFSGVHALENFGTLTLSGTTVANNVSSDTAIDNFGSLIVASSTFTGNAISSGGSNPYGAAIRNDGGDVQISASSFSGNNINNGSGTGLGGAVFNDSGTMQISGGTFSANKAFDGGAINMRSGYVRIKGATFSNNIAGYGGAIENDGADLFVSTSTFSGNSAASGDGGAFWNLFGTGAIEGSAFSSNTSNSTGGAISCYGSTLSVADSTFSANQSGTTGGGVFSECGLTITNSTFSANVANGLGGGGIYQNSTQNAVVTYVTVAGNSSTFGGGIYNDGGSSGVLTVARSILAANTGGSCDGVIASGGYNLANDTTCGGAFGATDKANATLPLGALANNGGPTQTRLPSSGNQAINFVPIAQCGNDRDQRNAGRPSGAGCDSGAVEVNGVFDGIFADDFDH